MCLQRRKEASVAEAPGGRLGGGEKLARASKMAGSEWIPFSSLGGPREA